VEERLDDEARARAFGTVFVVTQHLTRLADAALEPLGLTTKQWLLLAVLTRGFAGRQPTLSEAAASYGSSRQNVKAIAVGLAESGWLDLVTDDADRRVVRLRLTERVRVFDSPEWRTRQTSLFTDLFGPLPASDVRTLGRLLEHWLAALTPTTATALPAPERFLR